MKGKSKKLVAVNPTPPLQIGFPYLKQISPSVLSEDVPRDG